MHGIKVRRLISIRSRDGWRAALCGLVQCESFMLAAGGDADARRFLYDLQGYDKSVGYFTEDVHERKQL